MSYAIGANEKFVGYHGPLRARGACDCTRAQLKYMVLTPQQNTMPLINNGTADFNCASMTNNLTRQKQVAFGFDHLYVSEVRMAVRADSGITSFQAAAGQVWAPSRARRRCRFCAKYASDNELNFKTLMRQGSVRELF